MARERGNLTSKQVGKLVRAGKPGKHYDRRGLQLEIKSATSANWVARYQLSGVARYMGLGSAFDFDLRQARERNSRLVRQKLADGTDPVLLRQSERATKLAAQAKLVTFSEATRRYLEQHGGKWESAKHRGQWESTLKVYAEPIIGKVPVGDIDVPLVLKVLEQPVGAARGFTAGPLWETRPETGSRLRSRLENILDWAKGRGYRQGDNPAAWDVVGKVLPARGAKKHHAALPYAAAPALMAQLRAQPGVAAQALQFLIYTAARSQEALKARWSEIDFDKAVWNVPAERMKARKPHRVPLAPEVIELLRGLYRELEDGDGYLFIGTQAGKPLAHTALQVLLKRLQQPVTVHGMRSAFRDWAGETTAFPPDICEAALAHVRGDKTVQAYARGDLFQKRTGLMRAWAKYCNTPPVKGDVIPLRGAR
jgi:integrase